MKVLAILSLLLSTTLSSLAINVGDTIPSINLHHGFPPEMVNVHDYVQSKKVILVGLPGAFTPT